VVASTCSQNHFISEKNKAVQSYKLLFLQICPRVRQYTSAGNCKCVGDVPGSHIIESLFSFSVALSIMSVASQKRHPFNAVFSQGNKYKAGSRSGEYGGCSSVVTLFFAKKYLTKTNQSAGALS
jgi:ribosomal protein L33